MYEIGRLFREHISDGLIRSAPYLLGSLQILFDPVGMFRSLGRGISGIISLPVEGIRQKSLSTFISGLGHGSANLLKEISGEWFCTTFVNKEQFCCKYPNTFFQVGVMERHWDSRGQS